MNKSDLAKKILSLEGLTNEERSALLGLIREHKKYGLVWEDKPEDVEKRLETELPVLREVADRAIISDNPDAPNHILIEGDNLEALTTLAYTHAGKIDVIYIDPPYNTGKNDFVYNDKIIDKEDGFKHTKWLSFISKRLKIASILLKPNGVIFISIDDNEQSQLKMLCDEIFRVPNFLACITVKGNPRGRQSSTYFAQVHDFLLAYRKSADTQLNGFDIPDNVKAARFNKRDEKGLPYEEWELRKRGAGSRRIDSPNLWFPIYYNPNTGQISIHRMSETDIAITPKLSDGTDGRWRWSREKVEREKNKLYVRITSKGSYNVYERKYVEEKNQQLAPTLWDFSDVNTELGTKLLKSILNGDSSFDFPKPVGLIKRILSLVQATDAIVLDFFAGSGTTLHATMQLNAEDGGKRTCILCTNNENGICENVTYERNKRVIKGYTTPKGEHVEGLKDNNLRYYRTEFVGRRRTPANLRQLVQLSTDMLCIKEDLYTELPQFAGFNTHPQVYRFFSKGDKHMLIIYHEGYVPAIAKAIATTDYSDKIKVYVFSPSEDPWTGEFADVEEKVELCALPAAILNAYKRVLPKPKDATLGEAAVASMSDDDEIHDGLFGIEKGGEA